MTPEIAQLEAFAAVAAQLHFGRAANQLHVTQSTVSHRIRALEACVGVRLFERTRRQVRLTAAGVAYLDRVGPLLRELTRAREDAHEAASGSHGRLVIGYSGGATNSPLVSVVAQVARSAPHIQIELQQRGLHDQMAAVNAGDIDIGCSFLDLPHRRIGLRVETLRPVPVKAWVGTEHRLAGAKRVRLADLQNERWVLLSERAETGVRAFLERRGATLGTSAIEVDAIDAAYELVRLGVAVTAMPHSPAVPEGVVGLSLEAELMANVWVFWNETRVSPGLRLFLDALEPMTVAPE